MNYSLQWRILNGEASFVTDVRFLSIWVESINAESELVRSDAVDRMADEKYGERFEVRS